MIYVLWIKPANGQDIDETPVGEYASREFADKVGKEMINRGYTYRIQALNMGTKPDFAQPVNI